VHGAHERGIGGGHHAAVEVGAVQVLIDGTVPLLEVGQQPGQAFVHVAHPDVLHDLKHPPFARVLQPVVQEGIDPGQQGGGSDLEGVGDFGLKRLSEFVERQHAAEQD